MRVAVTGSSGLVGTALVHVLGSNGHQVLRLVRRPPRAGDEARWDPERREIEPGALEGVDAVVNLAGENLAGGRWTAGRKARLYASRIGPTRFLVETLAGLERRPEVLVSASAVGYYGDRGSEWQDEASPPADDTLGRLAADWERATEAASRAGLRVVRLRTGMVLSAEGGALGRMLPLFRAGLGGPLGGGSQYLSWIAIDDLTGVILRALADRTLSGPVNAVAPGPVTNADLARSLGRVLHRPAVLPAPAFALRLVFGELADAALLASIRVRPARLLAAGYVFRLPGLEAALQHVLARRPEPPPTLMRNDS